MFSFKPFVFAVILAESVGATVVSRKLSYPNYAAYDPPTNVVDHSAVALDQQAIEQQIGKKNDVGLRNGQDIYEQGAYSKPVARLELTGPLASSVAKGKKITGKNANGEVITGKSYRNHDAGDMSLFVQYATNDDPKLHVECAVGGLQSADQRTEGCFGSGGEVTIQDVPGGITYGGVENINGRNIQGFSTNDLKHRASADSPYFEDFQTFTDYYGRTDYADEWITAAFEGRPTSMQNGADFSNADFAARVEGIKKGTVYSAIAMYVIRELEDAIADCSAGCAQDSCNDDAVHALDEAAAFYYGSLYNEYPGVGNLQYALGQKRCANFNTCDGGTSGTAIANLQITDEMVKMQKNLQKGNCEDAKMNVAYIVSRMKVPLIQGALRYAYKTDPNAGNVWSTKAEAEGSTFAFSVLPWVDKCSPSDAKTIYNNLKLGQGGTANFQEVKKAFENNYNCMGIYCNNIGGLVDSDGAYYEGAEPCNWSADTGIESSAASNSLFAVVTLGALGLISLMF